MLRSLVCVLVLACGCGGGGGGAKDDKGGQAGRVAAGGSGGESGAAAAGGKHAGGQGGTSDAGGTGGRGGDGQGGSGPTSGTIKLVTNVVVGKQKNYDTGTGGVGAQHSALRVGSPSATSLISLKYYITSIQLCEDAEGGCISLFHNKPADSPDYGTYTVTAAQNDENPGHYTDLMSAFGRGKLNQSVDVQVPVATAYDDTAVDDADGGVAEVPKRQAGVYRYVLMDFYRPVRVKAEFPIVGETSANYFRTRAVTGIHQTTLDNGWLSESVDIGDTLNGATEEMTYMLQSSGVAFVFQKPFVVSQDDVIANRQFFVDLVFDPESFGQAYIGDCKHDPQAVVCDFTNNVTIDVPVVRMSPVLRRIDERTHKETYLLEHDASSQIRVELYYSDGDPEASVQGVDMALVYNSDAAPSLTSVNTLASNFVTQRGSVNSHNAALAFFDYQRNLSLSGLVRRQNGTATIHCLHQDAICDGPGDMYTRAYQYVDDRIVAGD